MTPYKSTHPLTRPRRLVQTLLHPHHNPTHAYPPNSAYPTTRTNPPSPPKRRRKRRSALKTFYSVLYHTTFYFFILITAALLVGSAYGLGEQALRTGGQRKWNLFVLSAAYVALVCPSLLLPTHSNQKIDDEANDQGLVSIVHVWSRILSVKKILRSMPKPYMPTKQIDLPKVGNIPRSAQTCLHFHNTSRADRQQKVSDHIMTEYSRTAVIAHISQATTGQQEGWGRPGERF